MAEYLNQLRQRIFIILHVIGQGEPLRGVLLSPDGSMEYLTLQEYESRFQEGDFFTAINLALQPPQAQAAPVPTQQPQQPQVISPDITINMPGAKKAVGKVERDSNGVIRGILVDYKYD
jgi:hypothetical protein